MQDKNETNKVEKEHYLIRQYIKIHLPRKHVGDYNYFCTIIIISYFGLHFG